MHESAEETKTKANISSVLRLIILEGQLVA